MKPRKTAILILFISALVVGCKPQQKKLTEPAGAEKVEKQSAKNSGYKPEEPIVGKKIAIGVKEKSPVQIPAGTKKEKPGIIEQNLNAQKVVNETKNGVKEKTESKKVDETANNGTVAKSNTENKVENKIEESNGKTDHTLTQESQTKPDNNAETSKNDPKKVESKSQEKSKVKEKGQVDSPDITGQSDSADNDSKGEKDDSDDDKSPKLTDLKFYKDCDYVFKTYVNKKGMVDYLTLRRKKLRLISAVEELGEIPPGMRLAWSDEDYYAFLLNAHNILVLNQIIDNYPIKPNRWLSIFYPANSIKHISGARDKQYFRVAGLSYTLDEIEKELLKKSNDLRFCFALSHGTVSGATLRNEAYDPNTLDKQLDKQVKKYLAKPENFKIDSRNGVIHLSSLFKLENFKEAFLNSEFAKTKRFREYAEANRAFLNFIYSYIPEEKAKEMEFKKYDIEFRIYDWELNEQNY